MLITVARSCLLGTTCVVPSLNGLASLPSAIALLVSRRQQTACPSTSNVTEIMSPTEFGPKGLLQHDTGFGVLICRECQYAIQKSAIESHLLKHKIYRNERQSLLSFIAELDLKEPEDVSSPSTDSTPIAGLPIIPGFRCQVAGCGSLCASQKRMKRHHSEDHSINDSSSFSTLACPAKLQTFFRGTKIRYFEIARPSASIASEVALSNPRNGTETSSSNQIAAVVTKDLQPTLDIYTSAPRPPPVNINLAALTYLHHFTITTSRTLPCTGTTRISTNYWQTQAVSHALREHWLMCGLLAISAYHSAALEENEATKRTHIEQSRLFSAEFFGTWVRKPRTVHDSIEFESNEDTRETSDRIGCILSLMEWTSTGNPTHQNVSGIVPNSNKIQLFMTQVRNFAAQDPTALPSNPARDQEDAFVIATQTLKSRPTDRFSNTFNYLSILPNRIAETLGRSEIMPDVMVILCSIAILVICCAENFSSDEAEAGFMTMAAWLARVPDRFHQMVAEAQPAALILTACWAAILVRRARYCGCWFLGDSAKLVLEHVKKQVEGNQGIVRLVEDLERL
jgi:hypothetical protein